MTNNGLKMRDSIVTMINGIIDRQRPKPRVCEVYSYNRFSGLADVLLPGETEPGIQAKFPQHLQPTASKMDDGVGAATGDLVLVEGTTNNYRITQIIRGNAFGLASPMRPSDSMSGGGVVTWNDRYLKWGSDLVAPTGVTQLITGGLITITMPVLDTVIKCHGINGDADDTVAAAGIDMQPDGTSDYSVLYYEPNLGSILGDTGTFHLVGATVSFNVPATWIMIALMDQVTNTLRFCTDSLITVDATTGWWVSGWGDLDTSTYGPSRAWFDPVKKWIEVELYISRTGANTAANSIHSPVIAPNTPIDFRPINRVNLVVANNIGGAEKMSRLTMLKGGESNPGRMDILPGSSVAWNTGQFAFIKGGWKVP